MKSVGYFVPRRLPPGLLQEALGCAVDHCGIDRQAVTVELSHGPSEPAVPLRLDDNLLGAIEDLGDDLELRVSVSPGGPLLLLRQPGPWLVVEVFRPAGDSGSGLLQLLQDRLQLDDAGCLALALSGGGFRATLFHLGVVRFLRDAGLLQKITHIYSVSGGSVLAANLVQHWDEYARGDVHTFEAAAARLIAFTQSDVRGRLFRRWILSFLFPLLRLGRKHRWTRIRLLQSEYDRLYARRSYLNSLVRPGTGAPELQILATALKSGDMCSFTSHGLEVEVGSIDEERAGENRKVVTLHGRPLRISLAVAASSAFPPIFPPVEVTAEVLGLRDMDLHILPHSSEYLSDGGVFDNLGICKFAYAQTQASHRLAGVVVSDAGTPFGWEHETSFGTVWRRAVRASFILMKRVADLDHRNFSTSGLTVLPCRILDTVPNPALEEVLQTETCHIRTDLDAFSDLEVRCLVMHGYMVARQALQTSGVVAPDRRDTILERTPDPWDPKPTPAVRRRTDEEVIKDVEALRQQQRRGTWKYFAMFLPWKDWAAFAATLLFAFYLVLIAGAVRYGVYLQRQTSAWALYQRKFEDWNMQVTYHQIKDLDLRERLLNPEQDPNHLNAARRLFAIADLPDRSARSTGVVVVHVRRLQGHWSGFTNTFRFPGKTEEVLIQFYGGKTPSGEIDLTFMQEEAVAEEGQGRPPYVFQIQFSESAVGDIYEGVLKHPQLTDLEGNPLSIAEVVIWKP